MALTPSATRLLEVAALAVVYYVAGRLGQFLAIPPGNVTAVWAPSGIALAAVLLYGNRVWPGIWLGSFFGNTWAFFDPTNNWTVVTSSAVGASIGMGATLEALAGKFFLQRLGISHSPLDRARDFLKFVGLAGVIGCTVSATIGVTSLCLGGFASWENYAWTWGTWWLGDTAGVLMVTPLILAWNSESLRGWTARKTTEAVLLLGLTIVLMPIAFGNVLMAGAFHAPLQFIVLPLLVWSAFRFGQLGTTTLIGVIAVGGIWATAHGVGPFVRESVNESLLLMQAFMGVHTVTLLAMTAVITERKQTEEALREQKERFHLVINYANDAIFHLALDGTIQWVSRQATVLTGKPVAELVGRSITSILTHEGATLAEVRLAAVRRGESVRPLVEFEVRRPDGSAVWVEANITSVLEDGTVVGRLLVARDITARKRSEEALRESEGRYKTLVESASLCIHEIDPQGRLMSINQAGLRMMGAEHEAEIKGRAYLDVVAPEDRERIGGLLVRAYAGEMSEFEFSATTGQNMRRFASTFIPLRGAGGSVIKLMGITQDITERKQTEESLKLFRALLDQVRDSIEVIDPQTGRFMDGNEKAWSNLGYARNELLAITVPDIDPLVTKTVFANNMHRLRETGETLLLDSIHLRKDGTTFPVEVSAQLVQHGKGKEYVVAIVRDITERKRAEEALREANAKLRTIFDAAPVGLFVIDPDGRIQGWSAGAERIFGWSEQEALGRICPTVPEEELDAYLGMIKQMLKGESFAGLVRPRQRKDGTRIVARISGAPLYDSADNVQGIVTILEDITARVRVEEALRESEERLAHALDATTEGVWDWNIQTGEVLYSPRWMASLGYSPEDVPRHVSFWESVVHPDDMPRVWKALHDHWEGRTPFYECENRMRTKAGEWRYNLDRGRVVEWDAAGKPLRMVGTDTDITARKQAEEALRDSQVRLQLAVQASNLGPWDWDLRTNAVHFSPEWKRQIGHEEHEIPGRYEEWESRLHPEDREPTLDALRVYLDGRQPEYTVEFRLRHKDGSYRWIYTRGEALRGADGKPFRMLGCHLDITERKQAESMLTTEKAILGMLVAKTSLAEILDALCRQIEEQTKGAKCSVLLLDADGVHMRYVAAPSLPESYVRDLDGFAIGPTVGSCGTAAYEKRQVIVADISTDPLWADYRDVGLRNGIRACWSTPIFSAGGKVLGTFAMFYGEPRSPREYEVRLAEQATNLASIAIERKRAEEALQQAHQKHQELVNTIDGIVWEADAQTFQFLYVSQKAERLLGYPLAQWLSKPTFWADHIHPDDRERTVTLCVNATKEVRNHTFECRMLAADGHTVWLQDIVTVVVENNQAVKLRGVMVDITEQKQVEADRQDLYERLQESHKGLRTLSQRLLEVQEKERHHLARELHDEVGQALTAAKINIQQAMHAPNGPMTEAHLAESVDILDSTLQQIRNLALDLRPSLLDDLGLAPTLRWLVDRHAQASETAIRFSSDLPDTRAPLEIELACYRITQEALTNAVRHAHAVKIAIELKHSDRELELTVCDNGVGFDLAGMLARAREGKSFGLLGMQERVSLVGGCMDIQSRPGNGTRIHARFPLIESGGPGTTKR